MSHAGRVSDELAQFLGGKTSISRPELTSAFWEYVKSNNLQVRQGSHAKVAQFTRSGCISATDSASAAQCFACCRILRTDGRC